MSRQLPPAHWYPAARTDVRASLIRIGNGERVRVVEAGPIDGVPVVMLHGWGGSAYSFRELLPLAAAAGLRALALDLRGHGQSDKPRDAGSYSSAGMARQAIDVLDALNLTSAILVGQSMGGAVALDAAAAAPARARGVVLVAPVGLTPIRRIALARFLRASRWIPVRVPRWGVHLMLYRIYGNLRAFESTDVDEYWAPAQDEDYVRALWMLVNEFDWQPRRAPFDQLNGRIRIVLGQRDRLIIAGRAKRRVGALPPAHITVVRGAGHLVAEESPEAVMTAISELLKDERSDDEERA